MNKYPIFNYLPLEEIHAFLEKQDSDEARELLEKLRGVPGTDGCCWGNPCYYKSCLACFCRGNIKYLTTSQAYTQDHRRFSVDSIEGETIKSVIDDIADADKRYKCRDGVC